MEGPCLNCVKRHVNCHSTCKEYTEFVIKWRAYKELIRKERQKKRFSHSKINNIDKWNNLKNTTTLR